MSTERDTYVERVTCFLVPKEDSRAREAMTLDGLYEGNSPRIVQLVRTAYRRGVRRGAAAAWSASQPVSLRRTPATHEGPEDAPPCSACGSDVRGQGGLQCECPAGPVLVNPAPGTHEAVAQEAEAFRGFTPGPWGVEPGCYTVRALEQPLSAATGLGPPAIAVTTDHTETGLANAHLIAAAPDLLQERGELRRAIASWKVEEEDWKRREAELLTEVEQLRGVVREGVGVAFQLKFARAEVERLRADREADAEVRSMLFAEGAQASAREENAIREREALADSLEEIRNYVDGGPPALDMDRSGDALRLERDACVSALEASLLFHFGKTAQELSVGATEANTGGPGSWVWLALEALRGAGRLG